MVQFAKQLGTRIRIQALKQVQPTLRPVSAAPLTRFSTLSSEIGKDPDKVWQRLQRGNSLFSQGSIGRVSQGNVKQVTNDELQEHVGGQSPVATVITCSDSRISPEMMFDCGLGDLFVIRNAGNVLSEDAIATVEFGVEKVGIPLLMVVGHEKCAAVEAAVNNARSNPSGSTDSKTMTPLQSLLSKIHPAAVSTLEAMTGKNNKHVEEAHLQSAAVCKHVENVVSNLESIDSVRQAQQEGRLKVMGVMYWLHSGKIEVVREPK